MKSIGKWVLGAAVLAGGMVLGTSTADAAQWRVSVGVGQSAYIPPCPGPGYTWVNGYYDGGYWVPGSWNYVGGASYTYYGSGYRTYDRDDHRGWDRDHNRRVYDRDDHRRFDRDDHRRFDRDDHRDRDHDRGRR